MRRGDVSGQYLDVAPVLVFEVRSPSTVYKDRHVTYALYEAAGVRHYALVDPEAEALEVFTPPDGRYAPRQAGPGDRLAFDPGAYTIEFDTRHSPFALRHSPLDTPHGGRLCQPRPEQPLHPWRGSVGKSPACRTITLPTAGMVKKRYAEVCLQRQQHFPGTRIAHLRGDVL